MRNAIVRMSGCMVALVISAGVAAAQPSVENEAPVDEARERAEDAYDRAFILFEDEYATVVSLHDHGYGITGSITTTRSAVPIRGVQRDRLSPIEFYEGVGRSDLAAEYQSGRRKKLVVGGASAGSFGLSVLFAGVAVSKMFGALAYENCDIFSPEWEACTAAEDRRQAAREAEPRKWAIGAGVALVGAFALGAIYRRMDAHPVSESERRLLAHDHNQRLRRELRLPRKRRDVSVSPFVTGEGGGVMAVGSF